MIVDKTTLTSVLALCSSDESQAVTHEEGYYYYVSLPSGWNAAFRDEPNGRSKVQWLFQRSRQTLSAPIPW